MRWILGLIGAVIAFAIVAYWMHSKSRKNTAISTTRNLPAIRSKSSIKRAIAGTFDESVFINSNNNKFRFPKYKSSKNSLVEIIDTTNYGEDLESEEKRNFNIKEFEIQFDWADIEIEPFWSIFDKSKTLHLEPHRYLKGHGCELHSLINEFEEAVKHKKNKYVVANAEWIEKLLADGYLSTYNFSNNEEILDYKTQYLKSLTVEDLKNICKGAELKTTLKKAQLIEQILSKECDLKIPTAVAKNDNFDSMMKKFYHLYIEDIKKTIDSWHPLIIREVWNCVSTDSECEAVGKMAKNILTDSYWNERLKDEPI